MCSNKFLNRIAICAWNINGIKDKFLSENVCTLFTNKDLLIISETHFGVRHKVPDKFVMVARSKPLAFKNLRGGVIIYKKIDTLLKFNVLCDSLNDLIVIEIESTRVVIVATYIPPANTKYYSDSCFENLELVLNTFAKYRDVLIVGDINARIGNRFPSNNIRYKINPDTTMNAHGGKLIEILKHQKLYVLNGIEDGSMSFDSKFTFIRTSGRSQVDLAVCNNLHCIKEFKIEDKIPQSDHCALSIDLSVKITPSFETIGECASGIRNYSQYNLSRRIKCPINVKKLNLVTTQNDLVALGDELATKYVNVIPSQQSIDEFANDLTNRLYDCLKKNKITSKPTNRTPQQQNCTSKNFKAIADAHKIRFESIHNDETLAEHHRQEWLFYQSVSWEKEEEELCTAKNNKWRLFSKDPKKLWKMIDYKGEIQSGTSCPPKLIRSYFSNNIFNSSKISNNPVLADIADEIHEYDNSNDITDSKLTSEELSLAIRKYGNGVSFDGLPGKVLSLLPPNLRNIILQLYDTIFKTFYPSLWQSQLLSPIEKKGHALIDPKLRGIAVGPMFSRLYDIMVNFRMESWYSPNPEQAAKKKQGCVVQIFGLFLMLDMAKYCGKTLFIGLLDFEKAFDFMNRPTLMQKMMKDGIGCIFLKNLYNMYKEIRYHPKISSNLMDEPILSEHGVTQGRNSSGNIFSYYISDMNEPMEGKGYVDFMLANLLQLADDSLILAELIKSLLLKFSNVFGYCADIFCIVNMDKTNYMEFSKEPSLDDLVVDGNVIKPVDPKMGYVWLGFHLSYNSEIHLLIAHNLRKKKSNEAKFYAWLNINKDTPFPFKLNVVYGCFLPAMLYSCETWGDITAHVEELLIIEKKALRAILGVKKSTPDNILYVELNKCDIIHSIRQRQLNFFKSFLQLTPEESTTRGIWQRYEQWSNSSPKPFFEYYASLTEISEEQNLSHKKEVISTSDTSMHERYRSLIGFEHCRVLYSSLVSDHYRCTITRWRLSCHPLFIETGRYKRPKPPRIERTCLICAVVEDEEHSLFSCRAHVEIRHQHRKLLAEYITAKEILHPRSSEDIISISKYLQDIEENMDKLKIKR